MNKHNFGNFLATLRKEKGLTQKQLSEKINITDKAVSCWENGRNYPDIEILEQLAEEFDVTINELLEGRRIPKEELLAVSENQVVEQIKTNKKSKKKYKIIILAFSLVFILLLSHYILRLTGIISETRFLTIDLPSRNIVSTIDTTYEHKKQNPNLVDGWLITTFNAKIDSKKEIYPSDESTHSLYFSSVSLDGKYFYLYDNVLCEYKRKQPIVHGLQVRDLSSVLYQLDLSLIEGQEPYNIFFDFKSLTTFYNQSLPKETIDGSFNYMIFSDNTLKEYDQSPLTGTFFVIDIDSANVDTTSTKIYVETKQDLSLTKAQTSSLS